MKVQCMLCNTYEYIDDDSFLAKRYRNHPLKTHLCNPCKERIAEKTKARLQRKQANEKMNATDYI